MSTATGFRLITPAGDRVGKVCGETDAGYVIAAGGPMRRVFHVLPREHAWPDETKRILRLTVPRQRLLASPPAEKDGTVDAAVFERYWAQPSLG
jgi:hypothetical protein